MNHPTVAPTTLELLDAVKAARRDWYAGKISEKQVHAIVDIYRDAVAEKAKAIGRRWKPSRAQVLRTS